MKYNLTSGLTQQKRLRLRVAAKLMIYLAFAGIVYVFISAIRSGTGEVPVVPSLRVDLSNMSAGKAEFLSWQGRPVLIYQRTYEDKVTLGMADERLKDADSAHSEQPAFAQNPHRSQFPDWFVAIALGTGQGCTVVHQPPSDALFQGTAWSGGFRDSCGEDRYDTAGRVYAKQYASENLQVPQYTIEDNTLILGR